MSDLFCYAKTLAGEDGRLFSSGEVFAKVLSPNDDSGRHGVLIPTDAYSFFPDLTIPDPTQNATTEFPAFNSIKRSQVILAYKYYERYPERRITRLPPVLNEISASPRLLIFLRVKRSETDIRYYFDCANSAPNGRFAELFRLIFGENVAPNSGAFVVRPVDSNAFSPDSTLAELLGKFDEVKRQGWIDAKRTGDTGIGYTFETLLGIKENNDKLADYKGIEIKCKGIKENQIGRSTKINLFQSGPEWVSAASAKERIRMIGKAGSDGLYTCYSQVTTTQNNLGLLLNIPDTESQINLRKLDERIGFWPYSQLEKRLAEKHSRTVFVKAKSRIKANLIQFFYDELVYCDRPSIDRFVKLVSQRNIVFEFTMSEKADGTVRNHGYPWRLIRDVFLDQLFSFQIKLR